MKRQLFTIALAVGLTIALGVSAHAAIVSFTGMDIPIPTNPEGVYVDLHTGTSGGSQFSGADANFFFGGFVIGNDADLGVSAPSWQPVRLAADNASSIANLPFGTSVGLGSLFGDDFGGSFTHIPGEFTAGTPGYIGFSLDTGGGPLYGWALVTLEANTTEGVLHAWAFQDDGSALMVGVPEPGSLLLALLGVATLLRRRRI